MTNTLDTEKYELNTVLDEIFLKSNASQLLQKIKVKAWDQFKTLGLPTRKLEAYRYIPLRKIFDKPYKACTHQPVIKKDAIAKHVLVECIDSCIVMVNGAYSKELSSITAIPSRVVISSLNEAMTTYGSFLTNHFTKTLKDENDAFAALNAALGSEGVFIYLPPKTVLEKPIQILHLIDTNEETILLNPRLQVFVGAQSSLECILSHTYLKDSDCLLNHVSDFAIEDDSHVRLDSVLNNVTYNVTHLEATRAILKKNCTFHCTNLSKGSLTVRNDYKMTMTGENSECALNNLWMLQEKNEHHSHVLIDHQAPNCRSRQLFKGALDDFGRSSFEGKILVRQAAQKTDAFQLNANLLLNDNCQTFSKPNLEIFADDVKASHGATFGQLNQEQLFCLRARGISELDAKNLLIFGFCKEIIDLVTIPSLRNLLMNEAKTFGNEINHA